MTRAAICTATLIAILLAGCASALHEPTPLEKLAPGHANGRSADQLVREANAAWARHGAPGQAAAAQDLFLDAAVADVQRIDAVIGSMRAMTYRIEHDKSVDRGAMAEHEVELGQWCQRRAPDNGECDYRLAIALGQQARERTSTGKDAMGKIVDLLHRAITRSPALESAGPHRVLAIVLVRAPSWPIGPGDAEAALGEARAAVKAFPAAADNQLALGEALVANDQRGEARAAYERARTLAEAARASGDPEAAGWLKDAQAGLENTAGASASTP
jgi:hypothetical protein